MGPMGFEPMTSRLKAECSTTELRTHLYYNPQLKNAQILFEYFLVDKNSQSDFLNYGNILRDK